MCYRIELDETRFKSFRAWYLLAKVSEIMSFAVSLPSIVLFIYLPSYWLVIPYLHSLHACSLQSLYGQQCLLNRTANRIVRDLEYSNYLARLHKCLSLNKNMALRMAQMSHECMIDA